MHVIGLDIGTTGVKASTFDANGTQKGYAFREYCVICNAPGMGEQDVNQVWALTREVIREAVVRTGPADIKALSFSVQGDAIIPVDRDWNPIHHAILGMDYRSAAQAKALGRKLGERTLYERTGMRPHPMNSLAKMVWLRQTNPDVWRRAHKVMTYADFVAARLCARPVIDYTMASRTMAFDLQTHAWAEDILEHAGVDGAKLSEALPSGAVIGTIDPELAAELGVPPAMQVVSGGHDQTCAALGAGMVAERRAVISTGTAEVLSTAFAARPEGDTMFRSFYPCYLHAAKGLLFTFALNHTGGLLFHWYRDTLGQPEVREAAEKGSDSYEAITSRMPQGISPVLILPHFNGSGTPLCDLQSRGAIVGLSMATTRHDIAKAVLEALCFELRLNCQTLREAGLRHDELVAVGGGARSHAWLQMKADVLGCPVRTLAVREAACLGAGLLAGTACGMYGSIDEAVGTAVRTTHMYEPATARAREYEERFALYRTLYPALKTLNRKLLS